MSRRWVVNASPLIALAKVSRLSLLEELCPQIVIPAGVATEIRRGPVDDLCRAWLDTSGIAWVKDVAVTPVVAAWDLGLGESHVLSWACENRDYEAIIDDRAARRCAEAFRIPVRGTIGIILLARKEGHIDQAKPVLEALTRAGMRISPEILRASLALVGE